MNSGKIFGVEKFRSGFESREFFFYFVLFVSPPSSRAYEYN